MSKSNKDTKQSKLTAFFQQSTKGNKSDNAESESQRLSKNETLRQMLNDMKSKQGTPNPGGNRANPSIPYYAPILDQITEQRQTEKEKLQRSSGKHQEDLRLNVLNGCKQQYFHGPTHGDHTDGKATWKGYFEHRREKISNQCMDASTSVYGDLHSNGVHFKRKRETDIDASTALKKRKQHAREKNDEDAADKASEHQHCESENDSNSIFAGVTVYFNGRTNDLSSFHLNKLIVLNGGNFSVHLNQNVTHCITTNLSRSKINRALDKQGKLNTHRMHFVRSEWITDSVKHKKLMSEDEYLVFKTTKYGNQISDYFADKTV